MYNKELLPGIIPDKLLFPSPVEKLKLSCWQPKSSLTKGTLLLSDDTSSEYGVWWQMVTSRLFLSQNSMDICFSKIPGSCQVSLCICSYLRVPWSAEQIFSKPIAFLTASLERNFESQTFGTYKISWMFLLKGRSIDLTGHVGLRFHRCRTQFTTQKSNIIYIFINIYLERCATHLM